MSEVTSAQLLGRFVSEDSDAARQIHDRYLLRLMGLARRQISARLRSRIDAEDIVQSAYRSFFVAAAQGRFALVRAGDLWRLLAAIVIHKAQAQAARHSTVKRNVARDVPFDSVTLGRTGFSGTAPTSEEAVALVELLQRQLQELPPTHRQLIEARLQGHSIDQCAQQAGRSLRTVRRVLEEFERRLERELARR